MSRPPKKHSPRPKKSSTKDRELWDELAKSIVPFTTGKPRVRIGDNQDDKPAGTGQSRSSRDNTDATPAPDKTRRKTADTTPRPRPAIPARVEGPHRVPGLAQFDHKSRRRLGAGKIEIAARIDLHGMRRHEAHAALRGFLLSSQQRGLRWVLVITGKGAPSGEPARQDDDHWMDESARGRGILRQSVPQWLEEPEFRTIVVSHTTAAPHHGGEGARYIQLRTNRRNT